MLLDHQPRMLIPSPPTLFEAADKLEDAWLDTYRLLMSKTTTDLERLVLIKMLDEKFTDLGLAIIRARKQAS